MSNVQNDSEPRALSVDEAAEAILGRWTDGEDLSESTTETATPIEDDETVDEEVELNDETAEEYDSDETDPDDEGAEADEDTDEEAEDDEEYEILATDESVVEITVDGEIEQVSVKDLKRLYGQEASLTRKSQDLAANRRAAEQELQRTQLAYQRMIERAEARYKPYQDMDMLVASRQMDSETFAQLRADAKQAEDDVKFLREESDGLMQQAQQQHQQALQAAAQDCVRVLEEQMPDWGNELYNDIRSYAVSSGLPQEQVDQYVDPNVIMLINKARLWDQSQATVQTKKAKLVKSKRGKTKVLSSKKAPPPAKSRKSERVAKAQQKLRENNRSGSHMDDVVDALMARWEE